jgi:expansin (peptidoglycan-binding protein)
MGGTAGGTNCTTVPVPLASGNFDGDNSVWVPYSEGSAIPINVTAESLGITADTDPNVAHLGGIDSVYAGQFQRITIPEGAVTMTLTGYRYIVSSEDPKSTNVYDDMAIQMWVDALDPTAGRVGEFVYYTHMNPTNGWTMFMGTAAVSAYAGQAVDLDMWGFTDDSIITHFYIDSLALTALVCQ